MHNPSLWPQDNLNNNFSLFYFHCSFVLSFHFQIDLQEQDDFYIDDHLNFDEEPTRLAVLSVCCWH